jgi:hypothetical protein
MASLFSRDAGLAARRALSLLSVGRQTWSLKGVPIEKSPFCKGGFRGILNEPPSGRLLLFPAGRGLPTRRRRGPQAFQKAGVKTGRLNS